MESSSKAHETIVANMAIQRQISGEMTTKEITTEMKTRII